jgi:valyl-tRNA synthetase
MEMSPFASAYSHQDWEIGLYDEWENGGFFSPVGTGPMFSMVAPPPNITGELHMGHALNLTIQDVVARFKRLNGYRVLWVPGTDHAGIATQNVIDKQLQHEGTSAAALGREAFLKRVWTWKHAYGDRITHQIRRLGASVDWSYERFTMDDVCQAAVRHHFVALYQKGLIYRGEYIVNWCPKNKTAISDIEVAYEEVKGHLWHIRYPLTQDSSRFITVATTRPETLFGDTAVAVHPSDERYQSLIGQTVRVPLAERDIPIIADAYVDPQFGSGAVKITPAHDPNDFDMGNRHQLPRIVVMDESAVMNDAVPRRYQGLTRYACRDRVVADLSDGGYLDRVEDHVHNVGTNARSGDVIEPYLSTQWFVKMGPITPQALDVVETNRVRFVPDRWKKLYNEWMTSIRDWCISRQIWWGHAIPVWYCQQCECDPIVQGDTPTACPHCGATDLVQDPDVLDTWFSSALWPFSTMGWPQKTDMLANYYPTSLLVTGYDIVTFWVSRMITMGLVHTQTVPFNDVYIHGLIRDIHGKKMSKSVGNVINPLTVIDDYGADALRFGLMGLCTKGGQDIKLSLEKIKSCRNFSNKLWNWARFVEMCLNDETLIYDPACAPIPTTAIDRWILNRYHQMVSVVTAQLADYNFSAAADELWEFVWNQCCDWYIEGIKSHRQESLPVLVYVCFQTVVVMHPFMPFVTEAIWVTLLAHPRIQRSSLPTSVQQAMWPSATETVDTGCLDRFNRLFTIVREVRHVIKAANASPKDAQVYVDHADPDIQSELQASLALIQQLARVDACYLGSTPVDSALTASHSVAATVAIGILLPTVDSSVEQQRLTARLTQLSKTADTLQKKLGNSGFLAKAPAAVVHKVRAEYEAVLVEMDHIKGQVNAH